MKLTLCGSLRFEPYWHEANKQLGLAGHICYSVMTFPSIENGEKTWYTPEQKWTLDLAHLAKIEESDGVVMLNIDGYLGESSLRELEWSRMRGKSIYWTLTDDPRFRFDSFKESSVLSLIRGLKLGEGTARDIGNWVALLEAVKGKGL